MKCCDLRRCAFGLGAITLVIACTRCATWSTYETRGEIAQPAVTAPCSAPSDQHGWRSIAFPESSAYASFPAAPTLSRETLRTPIGPQSVMRYKVNVADLAFDAGYLPRSRSLIAALAGEEMILESACEGTAAHLRGSISRSRAIQVDGHKGQELEIVLDDEADAGADRLALARLVITDDGIYHAIVQMTGSDFTSLSAAGRRFIESLRFDGAVVSSAE